MKRVLLIMALLIVAVLPQNLLAQQPASSNLSDYYVSDIYKSIDVNRTVYNISKWGTFGGAALVTVGTVFSIIGAEIIEEQLKHTDSVGCWQSQFGFFGLFFGGITLIPSLPFYLWGLHLENLPNGSTLIMGEDPMGWGGFVDLACGLSNTVTLGGSMGYNFSRQMYVGLGVGCKCEFGEHYGPYYSPYAFPAYVDVRLRFGKSRIVPYVGLKGGFELSSVPIPYGSVEWGVSYQPKDTKGAWWYSLCLSAANGRTPVSVRIARSF